MKAEQPRLAAPCVRGDNLHEKLSSRSSRDSRGNYADIAHVVAFNEDGARSDPATDTNYINSVDNLMLLCKSCHNLIDANAGAYTRHALEAMKQARVELVRTAIRMRADELKTHVLLFEAPIGGRPVSIADHEAIAAIAPRHRAGAHILPNPSLASHYVKCIIMDGFHRG